MLAWLIIGLVSGAITAGVLHFAYFKVANRTTQFYVLVGTVFTALLLGVVPGMQDLFNSGTDRYFQADHTLGSIYILGWMITAFFGFAFPIMIGRKRSR